PWRTRRPRKGADRGARNRGAPWKDKCLLLRQRVDGGGARGHSGAPSRAGEPGWPCTPAGGWVMKYDVLRAPFPPELVRSRPGQHGETLSYIPTFAVIERLNAGCDQWD